MNEKITVITPTIGKPSLKSLVDSIKSQKIECVHITLWDNIRYTGEDVITPNSLYLNCSRSHIPICIDANTVKGSAYGSALRAIGLMAAQTEYVTFADDDVVWQEDHLEKMMESIKNNNWVITKRRIWTQLKSKDNQGEGYECLGVDDFESVGEEAKTPYKMVDNNCILFKRRYGTSAAVLYRETEQYNDDRLFYDFMKKYAGPYSKTGEATINQICPERLVDFFRKNCTQ